MKPKRAAKGTVESRIPVRLTDGQRPRIEKAARRAGLSVAEWIRRAADAALTGGEK